MSRQPQQQVLSLPNIIMSEGAMARYLFVEHAACDTRVEAGDTLTLKSMYVCKVPYTPLTRLGRRSSIVAGVRPYVRVHVQLQYNSYRRYVTLVITSVTYRDWLSLCGCVWNDRCSRLDVRQTGFRAVTAEWNADWLSAVAGPTAPCTYTSSRSWS
jgi:hypothetical protein